VAYERYVAAISNAVADFRKDRRVFPVLVAMEALDADACRRVAAALPGVPVVTSVDHDMREIVAVLRASHMMVSSRFHAVVTSMPALVPSAGITMDERLRNLLVDRGQPDLCLEADDPNLESNLRDTLDVLDKDGDSLRPDIGRAVARNLRRMARMGFFLEREVARRYPDFPVRSGVVAWRDYLPPLSATLEQLLAAWDDGDAESAPRPLADALAPFRVGDDLP
jgi:polysaccharide pyruvyl transferase WcaK-like protein